jgi:excinuclease ABC subunit A
MTPLRPRSLRVVRARTHNLRNVSCSIPLGALTVVTGPSGSGKSSLAFDTLYAEGQRRFVESMSTYARQYLERLERPDVDLIEPILPGVAIEQKAPARSARSTVGTSTEIHDVLRLLYTAIGTITCPTDGKAVRRHTPESIRQDLLGAFGEGSRILVAAPKWVSSFEAESALWRRLGYFRCVSPAGDVLEITSKETTPEDADGRILLLVGRHVLSAGDGELLSSLSAAFDMGDGELLAFRHGAGPAAPRRYRRGLVCEGCGRAFADPVPALFSFNSPRGACGACQGFGRIPGLDRERVVPDPEKTIAERPFAPFNSPAYESAYGDLARACRRLKIRRDVPWSRLSGRERRLVWEGEGEWYGVRGLFEWLEKKRYKVHVRVFLSRYRGYTTCPACEGARLVPEALAVRVRGLSIAALADRTLSELLDLLSGGFSAADVARAGPLLADLRTRVGTLVELGLPYLTLSRPMRTLSGGEAQRLQLGAAIGNSLTGTLYVLDEPTVGLHPRDTARLLGAIRRLAGRGNAVVAVEHDLSVIRAADHVIDLGPGAGIHGGNVVFEGTPAELEEAGTATGRAIREETGRKKEFEGESRRAAGAERGAPQLRVAEDVFAFGASPKGERETSDMRRLQLQPPRAHVSESFLPRKKMKPAVSPGSDVVRVVGARANNLKNVSVSFPLGRLVGVCGVSGSGKSSLVVDVLAAGSRRRLGKGLPAGVDVAGAHDAIEGLDGVTDVVLVDQSPLGRSARSNPATFTKAWDGLRALLARTPAARNRDLVPASFSFNTAGGRCERCEGSGTVTVDMQFLADVEVVCDACDGRRFKAEVLEVRLRGRNVHELLATTVDEARELFSGVPAVADRLAPLSAAGLGYVALGQSTATLSGGEAQRLKVASFLRRGGPEGRVLFVFDEPTTGLHASDVGVLLRVFGGLLEAGHSIVAIEHHPGFLLAADHLIELGPDGGPGGGSVLFEGPPARLVRQGGTATAEALRTTVESSTRWAREPGDTS